MREAAHGPACYGYMIERIWLHLFGEPFLLPAPEAEGFIVGFGMPVARSVKERPLANL
jgi:hypothetical protein